MTGRRSSCSLSKRALVLGICCFVIVFVCIFDSMFFYRSDVGGKSNSKGIIDQNIHVHLGKTATRRVNQTSVCDESESAFLQLPHNMSIIATRLGRTGFDHVAEVNFVSRLWSFLTSMYHVKAIEDSGTTTAGGECKATKVHPELPCVGDCKTFQDLLTSKWPIGKPKAAIYFLVQMSRLESLRRILCMLDVHFNNKYRYPVIVFSEDLAFQNDSVKKELRAATNSTVFFQPVSFVVPPHINLPDERAYSPCPSSVGYRHMCRFHAKTVYDQPIMAGLDYAWRLDDDSEIIREIADDIFVRMMKNNYTYGYIRSSQDASYCVIGLWEATCKYVREQKIETTFFNTRSQGSMYYNNFEVSKLSLWRSCEYQLFVDYIDRLGGIYMYRWGDGPIKSIGVSLFVEARNVYQFSDIGYVHQPVKPSNFICINRPTVRS